MAVGVETEQLSTQGISVARSKGYRAADFRASGSSVSVTSVVGSSHAHAVEDVLVRGAVGLGKHRAQALVPGHHVTESGPRRDTGPTHPLSRKVSGML